MPNSERIARVINTTERVLAYPPLKIRMQGIGILTNVYLLAPDLYNRNIGDLKIDAFRVALGIAASIFGPKGLQLARKQFSQNKNH